MCLGLLGGAEKLRLLASSPFLKKTIIGSDLQWKWDLWILGEGDITTMSSLSCSMTWHDRNQSCVRYLSHRQHLLVWSLWNSHTLQKCVPRHVVHLYVSNGLICDAKKIIKLLQLPCYTYIWDNFKCWTPHASRKQSWTHVIRGCGFTTILLQELSYSWIPCKVKGHLEWINTCIIHVGKGLKFRSFAPLSLPNITTAHTDGCIYANKDISDAPLRRLTIPLNTRKTEAIRLDAPQPLLKDDSSYGSFFDFPAINPKNLGRDYRWVESRKCGNVCMSQNFPSKCVSCCPCSAYLN